MNQIAADVQEGLLAIAVGAGLQVMAAMMAVDVDALCGPRGPARPGPDRQPARQRGRLVTLGGRRLPVPRPRVRAMDGSGELPTASYRAFSDTEVLGRRSMEQMLAGLSTRRYQVGLEPVGEQVADQPGSTSKSAVSRRFVQATEQALADEGAAADRGRVHRERHPGQVPDRRAAGTRPGRHPADPGGAGRRCGAALPRQASRSGETAGEGTATASRRGRHAVAVEGSLIHVTTSPPSCSRGRGGDHAGRVIAARRIRWRPRGLSRTCGGPAAVLFGV
jgi:hypothetical protein